MRRRARAFCCGEEPLGECAFTVHAFPGSPQQQLAADPCSQTAGSDAGDEGANKAAAKQDAEQPEAQRLAWLDALRSLLVLLLVGYAAFMQLAPDTAYYYGPSYHVAGEADMSTRLAFVLVTTFAQAHVHGLLLCVAGFLAHGSLQRHGAAAFLQRRAKQLLLPLAAWELLLRPACFLATHLAGAPLPAGLPSLRRRGAAAAFNVLRWYRSWYRVVGEGHVWLLALAFLLHVAYVAGCAAQRGAAHLLAEYVLEPPASEPQPRVMTRNVRRHMRRVMQQQTEAAAAAAAAGLRCYPTRGVAAVLGGLVGLCGATTFAGLSFAQFAWAQRLLHVQYCFVGQHVVAYVVGTQLARTGALARLPAALCYRAMAAGAAIFAAGFAADFLSLTTHLVTWPESQAAWDVVYAVYSQAFGVLWSLGLLKAFEQFGGGSSIGGNGNNPGGGGSTARRPGRLARLASLAADVYVLHPLALVACTLALRGSGLPPLRFATLATALVGASGWALALAWRRAAAFFDEPGSRCVTAAWCAVSLFIDDGAVLKRLLLEHVWPRVDHVL